MPFFTFLVALTDRCGGFVTYRELYNWIIHAYGEAQSNELVQVVGMYRALSDAQRQKLDRRIDSDLKGLLERHVSTSAFGHYRGKVRDLMIAFSTAGSLVLECGDTVDDWRLVGRKG